MMGIDGLTISISDRKLAIRLKGLPVESYFMFACHH
jgi:hypothetical protein